jgi:hypothetical protein
MFGGPFFKVNVRNGKTTNRDVWSNFLTLARSCALTTGELLDAFFRRLDK